MSSSEFEKRAKVLAKKHKPLFDSLIEFESTKRINTKIRMNFTIDKTISRDFKRYCRKHKYNMSAKIEEAMQKMVEE